MTIHWSLIAQHRSPLASRPQAMRGFTIVELMVAVVISIIASIVMFQVFSVSEAQKRTTVGGGDAQNNGNIAMSYLQNQIRMAGFGFVTRNDNMAGSLLGCQVQIASDRTLPQFAPVVINPVKQIGSTDPLITDADANTDTLLLVYGTGVGGGSQEGAFIASTVTAGSSKTYCIPSTVGVSENNQALVAPQNAHDFCETSPIPFGTVSATQNTSTCDATLSYRGRVEVTYAIGSPLSVSAGNFYNLGSPHVVGFRVRNATLEECDYMTRDCSSTGVWRPVAEGIASLRAQYRLSTGTYQHSLTETAGQRQCAWAQVLGVRFVLVARNGQFEKTEVTTTQPVWAGSEQTTDNPSALAIGITDPDNGTDALWKHYRYVTFETSTPIRNLVWMGAPTSPPCQ